MATVNKDAANWRLFGGGGLLVGGLLWIVGIIVADAAGVAQVGAWLGAVGILVVGIALFFVAFGQTGSNGAVGASTLGKLALAAFGLGWVLIAATFIFGSFGVVFPPAITYVVVVLLVLGGVASAFLIFGRGVARGAARWILFLPFIATVLFALDRLGWLVIGSWWLPAILAVLFAVTGLLYLLNRKDLG